MQQFIDKLIGKLEEETEKAKCLWDEDDYYIGQVGAFNIAIEIVNQLAEEYKGGWIPCSERLPETHGRYLTTCIGKDIPQIRLFEGTWDSLAEVLAWMPLPEPYRKSEEDKQVSTERPQVIHEGFNDHDCEVRYRCPCCNKSFGSWGVEKNENGNNCCPHCDVELDGIGV